MYAFLEHKSCNACQERLKKSCLMDAKWETFLFSKEYKGLHTYNLRTASNISTYLSKYSFSIPYSKKLTNAEPTNIGPIFTK